MKICPNCRRTYSDDSLNFCLDDGSVLTLASADPQETLVMNTRPSSPVSPTMPSASPTDWNTPVQGQFSMQPQKKKSRTWLWLLGIFVVLIGICGGGFAYVAMNVDSWVKNAANDNSFKGNKIPRDSKINSANTSSSPDAPPSNVEEVDMSAWPEKPSVWGSTQFAGGELTMSSKDKNYYFVQVASDRYETENATTRVTLRNIDNASSSLGYGLIFHSDATPLSRDYAFLIDTKRTRYRIVQHSPSEEKTIKPWTNSSVIKDGVQENTLEVRDKAGELAFYINGTMVTSIKNTGGPKSGVPGLYAGDALKIGFKNLQIAK